MRAEKINNQNDQSVRTGSQVIPKGSTPQYGLAGKYINATTRRLVPVVDTSKFDVPKRTTTGFSYTTPSTKSSSYTPAQLSRIDSFTPSSAYAQAMEYTNGLLQQLSSGRTSYTDKINSLMSDIESRAAFSYDPDTDPLFQNYLNSSMASGRTAMQDTLGQAASLTGGYGSTYATGAANGAYNSYVQQAYDALPDYYSAALSAYQAETDDMYSKLGMYTTADESEYSRLSNAYQLNYGQAQDMYQREYQNYWDTANYNYNVDSYNNNMAYQSYRDDQSYAMQLAEMQNDNAYRNAQLAESQRQYDTDLAYKQYAAQLERQYAADEAKRAATSNSSSDSSSSTSSDSKTKSNNNISESNYNSAFKQLDNAIAKSGYNSDAVVALIDSYVQAGYDEDRLIAYVTSKAPNTESNGGGGKF